MANGRLRNAMPDGVRHGGGILSCKGFSGAGCDIAAARRTTAVICLPASYLKRAAGFAQERLRQIGRTPSAPAGTESAGGMRRPRVRHLGDRSDRQRRRRAGAAGLTGSCGQGTDSGAATRAADVAGFVRRKRAVAGAPPAGRTERRSRRGHRAVREARASASARSCSRAAGWTASARPRTGTALTNRVAFWCHRTFDLPVENGFDELPSR
ncbi:thiazole biosynthesis protein ThiJ [Burkholderia anthina]|uniref:Thiazole biosynthesis protein ThiJ n=1 Tax=Burkholderia anthina TaxID=179879 RepID=A0A6P2GGV2_9BURK|nr:thiazole biosynthesis protein ThiJ [Burkholderia anthina]